MTGYGITLTGDLSALGLGATIGIAREAVAHHADIANAVGRALESVALDVWTGAAEIAALWAWLVAFVSPPGTGQHRAVSS
jgi:branched-subunit amino acid ABC-type transport system permease component